MMTLALSLMLSVAPTLHVGPTASMYELRLNGQVGQLAPGLGVAGWLDFDKKLDLGAALFGSGLGLGTNHPGAAFSLAPYVCYNPWGVCVGPGIDLASLQNGSSGLFQGFTWKNNFFFVLCLEPQFFQLLHFGG
jgi:hypothetical protein